MTYEGNCIKCGAVIERVGNRQPNIKRWVCFDCQVKSRRDYNIPALAIRKKERAIKNAPSIKAKIELLTIKKKKIEMRIEILTGRLSK